MDIHVHIERLILDGLPAEDSAGASMQAALSRELSLLLSGRGLGPELSAGGARPTLDAGTVDVESGAPGASPHQVAAAIHRSLTR
jgi:hypothetical protein